MRLTPANQTTVRPQPYREVPYTELASLQGQDRVDRVDAELARVQEQLAAYRHQAARGHQRAKIGLGTLIAGLTGTVASSLLNNPLPLQVASIATTTVGLGLFTHGLYQRDIAGSETTFRLQTDAAVLRELK
ncbi:MAG: hypothetical protein AB7S38_23395 [Vulcanimicrobiota bacterium]